MGAVTIQHVIINSGDTVSGMFKQSYADLTAIQFPTIDSAAYAYLQCAWDTTSANFVRAMAADGLGYFAIATNAGSLCATLQEAVMPYENVRVELSAAQTDVRTLTIISKRL